MRNFRSVILYLLIIIISACSGRKKEGAIPADLDEQEYIELGKQIAENTQAELLKTVQAAMAEGGPAYAVKFCNVKALELKDSLSNVYQGNIQRLSNKYRNPADKPSSNEEIEVLKTYERLHAQGKTLAPRVIGFDDRVSYYQPILVPTGACLVCHGDPATQIAKETSDRIAELYPEDKAVGYALGDFRGVWKITFNK